MSEEQTTVPTWGGDEPIPEQYRTTGDGVRIAPGLRAFTWRDADFFAKHIHPVQPVTVRDPAFIMGGGQYTDRVQVCVINDNGERYAVDTELLFASGAEAIQEQERIRAGKRARETT